MLLSLIASLPQCIQRCLYKLGDIGAIINQYWLTNIGHFMSSEIGPMYDIHWLMLAQFVTLAQYGNNLGKISVCYLGPR